MEDILSTKQTLVYEVYRNYYRLAYGGYCNDPANCLLETIETTADLAMEAIVTTLQTAVYGDYKNYCRLCY